MNSIRLPYTVAYQYALNKKYKTNISSSWMLSIVLMVKVWLPVSRFITPGKWGMEQKKAHSGSRSPVLQGGYLWGCAWGAAQWGSKESGPVGHMGILLELVPVPWKWMDFFYFSHVQDVSYTEEYFYYHSAALSNTQICISLARPKNLGKTTWGLWKWLNAPLSPVENIRVWCFMLVPLDCLCLVPEPDGLQTHLHVCCGSLSPLVDKFLSTELFFSMSWTCRKENTLAGIWELLGKRRILTQGLGWAEQGHLCCSAPEWNIHPRGPDSGMTQFLFRKSSQQG